MGKIDAAANGCMAEFLDAVQDVQRRAMYRFVPRNVANAEAFKGSDCVDDIRNFAARHKISDCIVYDNDALTEMPDLGSCYVVRDSELSRLYDAAREFGFEDMEAYALIHDEHSIGFNDKLVVYLDSRRALIFGSGHVMFNFK